MQRIEKLLFRDRLASHTTGRFLFYEVNEMENRIAIARFINGERTAYTEPLWQYDYGQELKIEGLELPSVFEVHFATELHGNAVTSLYNNGTALIPDQLIQNPCQLYAWVYLHDTESDGETEYQILMQVKKREIGRASCRERV